VGWLLLWAAAAGCPKEPVAVAPVPDAGPPKPRCAMDSMTAMERCALFRAVLHLDGPAGHELEWYATDCGKWPMPVDPAVRCDGRWAPLFGPDRVPDCSDAQFAAVNRRADGGRSRGLLLRLTPSDAGYDFALTPGQLAGEEPKEVETLCGSMAGAVDWADGGWLARTVHAPP
jgi:hypothetical protein